jgi:hypothetical protein
MNLLKETIEDIQNSGHTIADVHFVGSLDGKYSITWSEFEKLANVDYDNGYGAPEVATDLIIQFTDTTYLQRSEYDGSEWWSYPAPLPLLNKGKPFTKLTGGMWSKIGELIKGETK